jgi:hypothetical protein
VTRRGPGPGRGAQPARWSWPQRHPRTVGAAAAADALESIAKTEAASTKAAQLKAEADLIAAQQRLIKCQTNPAAC